MQDREHQPDDFAIEVVDLDTPEKVRPQRLSLAPRWTQRQRRVQWGATLSLIVVTLLVLLGSYPPTRTLVNTTFPFLQPARTPVSEQSLFYFTGSPSWGQLSLDGKAISHLPQPGRENPLQLSPGKHVALWTAAPFSTQHCIFSVPADLQRDSCFYSNTQAPTPDMTVNARQISMFPSVLDLPIAQRSALAISVQHALDTLSSRATVQPGEPYAVASEKTPIARAQTTLMATLHFLLDSNLRSLIPCQGIFEPDHPGCINNMQNCRMFCDASPYFAPAHPATIKEWDVFVVARASWDYALPDGTLLAHDQPDSTIAQAATSTGITSDEHMLPVRILWDGRHWQSSMLAQEAQHVFDNSGNQNPACASTWDEVQTDPELNQLTFSDQQLDWRYVSGANTANGCTALGIPLSANTPPTAWAECIHRFGVLLAANAIAHKAWPQLPLAHAF